MLDILAIAAIDEHKATSNARIDLDRTIWPVGVEKSQRPALLGSSHASKTRSAENAKCRATRTVAEVWFGMVIVPVNLRELSSLNHMV